MITIVNTDLKSIYSGDTCNSTETYSWDPREISQLIPIVYYGRSGTVFLSQLLDNHPQLLGIGHSEFRCYFALMEHSTFANAQDQLAFFIRMYGNGLKDDPTPLNNRQTVSGTLVGLASDEQRVHVPKDVFFDHANKETQPGSASSVYQFIDVFLSYTEKLAGDSSVVKLTAREFLSIFMASYSFCQNQNYNECPKAIYWNLHTPDTSFMKSAYDLYDKIDMVHSIRRPSQTFGSHFKEYFGRRDKYFKGRTTGEFNYVEFSRIIRSIFMDLLRADACLLPDAPGMREIGVRLDDIHAAPQNMLSTLCDWLGIDWSETMMEPTESGNPTHTVVSNTKQVAEHFSTAHMYKQHLDILPYEDILFFENYLYENYNKWGYGLLTDLLSKEKREEFLMEKVSKGFFAEQILEEALISENQPLDDFNRAKEDVERLLKDRISRPVKVFDILRPAVESSFA
jgi:hypothetical protein